MKRPTLREHLKTLKSAEVLSNGRPSVFVREAQFAILAKCDDCAAYEGIFSFLFAGAAMPLSMALEHSMESKRRSVEVFTEALTDCLARRGSSMARSLAEHARDPKNAEAIFEALRQLFAAPSSEAAPALAVLLAKQLIDGTRPGVAFCGSARLFADLQDDEFLALRRLIEGVDRLGLALTLPAAHLTSFPRGADPRGRSEVRVSRPAALHPMAMPRSSANRWESFPT